MIIGISGKKTVGKDTVGQIIQYLIYKNKYKNKIADITLEQFIHFNNTNQLIYSLDWQIKKFAAKLKEIVCILTGCTIQELEDEEFKNCFMPKEWNIDGRRITYRWFLQSLGTDIVRGIHSDTWVNALMRQYEDVDGYDIQNEYIRLGGRGVGTPQDKILNDKIQIKLKEFIAKNTSNWIITDTRFKNEFNAIKSRKGIVIRVNRYICKCCGETNNISIIRRDNYIYSYKCNECHHINKMDTHPSEISLDDAKFDYVIDNTSSIERLIYQVKQILIKENLITK